MTSYTFVLWTMTRPLYLAQPGAVTPICFAAALLKLFYKVLLLFLNIFQISTEVLTK